MSYAEIQRDIDRAKSYIAGHVMTERLSRSFDFRMPGKGSTYAYALTWTPGTVSLAGDLSELSIVHYHALAKFEPGMRWLAGSDWHYLSEKITRPMREEIADAPATTDLLMEYAWSGDRSRLRRTLGDKLGLIEGLKGAAAMAHMRKELLDAINGMDPRALGEFCYGLGLDDYYGSTRIHPHLLAQITAMQQGAAMIAAKFAPASEPPPPRRAERQRCPSHRLAAPIRAAANVWRSIISGGWD